MVRGCAVQFAELLDFVEKCLPLGLRFRNAGLSPLQLTHTSNCVSGGA